MSETVSYGATDWNQETGNGKKREDRVKLDYMKLKPGTNELRAISKPHAFHFHNVKIEGEPGFGQKVYCACKGEEDVEKCPVCELAKTNSDLEAKTHWLVAIIDRTSKTTKVLEIGKSIYDSLKELNQKARFGDPQKYDVDITKNKDAAPANFYRVTGLPPEPLTPEDLAMKEAFDFEDLGRRCQPPSVESVQKRLAKLLEGGKKIAKPSKPGNTPEPKSEEDDTPKFLEK